MVTEARAKIVQTQWSKLVERGRELAAADRGETRFELGDLALEAEPMAQTTANTGSLERLAQYAEDIGIAFNSLREYRRVAYDWPHDNRLSSVAWKVHRDLASYPDRANLIRSREWTAETLAMLKVERHPKIAPKRDERWWKAIQDELAALRRLNLTKPPRGVTVPVARQRAKLIREQIELAEQLAAVLEKYGATPRH